MTTPTKIYFSLLLSFDGHHIVQWVREVRPWGSMSGYLASKKDRAGCLGGRVNVVLQWESANS